MHELSVALTLVELAEREAARLDGARVDALHVRIGRLAGVVTEALLFSFDLAADGTAIAGARLVVEEVAVKVRCRRCGMESEPPGLHDLHCAACGGAAEVVAGRDLQLVALEVSDEEHAANR